MNQKRKFENLIQNNENIQKQPENPQSDFILDIKQNLNRFIASFENQEIKSKKCNVKELNSIKQILAKENQSNSNIQTKDSTDDDTQTSSSEDLHWERKKICTILNLRTVPQKLLAVQKVYLLKNGFILDENQISMTFQGKAQYLDNVSGILGQFNHFKCIKNIQINFKKGFASQNFEDYRYDILSTQYLVERFKSFNDSKFKQLSDLIYNIEKQYQQFQELKQLYNQKEQELKNKYNDPDYIQYLLKEKFDQFRNNPTFIIHFKAGVNGKLFDIQSANQNLLACQMVGIDVQNLQSVKNMYDKCIPDGMIIVDKQKFFEQFIHQVMFKNYIVTEKIEHKPLFLGPDLIQWRTRNGSIIKRNLQFRIYQENMHLFLVIVYDNV